jgi:transposase
MDTVDKPSPSISTSSPTSQSSHLSPLSRLDRWTVVVLSLVLHKHPHVIAPQVGCSRSTVYEIIKKYNATGDVEDLPRSGRPSLVHPGSEKEKLFENIIKQYRRFTPALLASKFQDLTGIQLSINSIKNLAHRLQYKRVRTKRVPFLSDLQRDKRLQFARENQGEEFDDVIFTDESYFTFDTSGYVWKNENEDSIPSYCHPAKYTWTVWGGIWLGGRTRLYIDSDKTHTLDSEGYQNILWEYFISSNSPDEIENPFLRLLQDNAKPHISHSTLDFIQNFDVELVHHYPANSPDLNAIEKVWAWMKDYICKRGPQTPQRYEELIQESWDSLPQTVINNFIAHTPKVVEKILESQGDNQ